MQGTPHVILCFLLVCGSVAYYSNEQAFQCYLRVQQNCIESFQSCAMSGQCMGELKNYQECDIPQDGFQKTDIFNGYCFRQWWNQAVHTRQLIDCLVDNCALTYNSVVSENILAKCTEILLFQDYIPCDEECMKEIQEKVGAKSKNTPIEEIYSQEFENKEAKFFIDEVAKGCISPEGRFRKMLNGSDPGIKEEELIQQEPEQL